MKNILSLSPFSKVSAVPKCQLFHKQKANTNPTLQTVNSLIKPNMMIYSG